MRSIHCVDCKHSQKVKEKRTNASECVVWAKGTKTLINCNMSKKSEESQNQCQSFDTLQYTNLVQRVG